MNYPGFIVALLLAAEILLFLDMGQTVTVAMNPGRLREVGFARHFIGERPKVPAVVLYFVVWMAVAAILAWTGIEKPRAWSWAVLALAALACIELVTTIRNHANGVGLFNADVLDAGD